MSRWVIRLSTFSSLLLLYFVSSLPAEVITPLRYPPGLERGDQYRLFFTTSQFRDATASNLSVYDDFVQSVADAAPVVGSWDIEWQAVVSNSRVDARDHTGTNGNVTAGAPIYLLDGSLMAPNYLQLWSPQKVTQLQLLLTELGTELENTPPGPGQGRPVWTGTASNGVSSFGIGEDWVTTGVAAGQAPDWFSFGLDRRRVENPFYAISETLTVPEPGESILFLTSLPLFLLLRKPLTSCNEGLKR